MSPGPARWTVPPSSVTSTSPSTMNAISWYGGSIGPSSGTRRHMPVLNCASAERNETNSSPGGAVSPSGRGTSSHDWSSERITRTGIVGTSSLGRPAVGQRPLEGIELGFDTPARRSAVHRSRRDRVLRIQELLPFGKSDDVPLLRREVAERATVLLEQPEQARDLAVRL